MVSNAPVLGGGVKRRKTACSVLCQTLLQEVVQEAFRHYPARDAPPSSCVMLTDNAKATAWLSMQTRVKYLLNLSLKQTLSIRIYRIVHLYYNF